MLARQLDDLLEEPVGNDGAGRVVRVVDEDQPGALERVGVELVEVGREAQIGLQRQQDRAGSGQQRATRVWGVPGVGRQRDVARVEEGEAEVVDALLGADRRNHLRVRVDLDLRTGGGRSRPGMP